MFSAIGETKKPLYILSFAGVLNILLNLFFVIVCNLDVAGVALASAISQCVSAGLILHALTRVQDCYALHFKEAKLDPAMTKSILALGLPAGFQNAIFAIANLFIQAGVNSFDSLMVKGNSAAANADPLIYDCMAAFYMARTTAQASPTVSKKATSSRWPIPLAWGWRWAAACSCSGGSSLPFSPPRAPLLMPV